MSIYVTRNSNGVITNAHIGADNVNFTFSNQWTVKAKDSGGTERTVMELTPAGDLWIKGDLKGGKIKGDYTIGSTGNKMEIFVDEPLGFSKNSGIRAINENGEELLRLGFQEYSSKIRAFLRFGLSYYREDGISIQGNTNWVSFGIQNNKVNLFAPISAWPTEGVDNIGDLPAGTVYLRSDSCLGVKR